MSGFKREHTITRKRKLQELKFQKVIENESNNIEESKKENRNRIAEIRTEIIRALNDEIKLLHDDKQIKILQWLNYWIDYLSYEDTFDSSKLMTYKRGDIVHVNFGFNVHNELGGSHYAVVVENDNPSTSGCITVVPLRSGDTEEEVLANIHERTEVYLGKGIIECGNGKHRYTVAKVNQIRTIDKMRILKPTNSKIHTVYPIDAKKRNYILDKIDLKIVELFTKPEKVVDNVGEKE